jgi:hypothetical protein
VKLSGKTENRYENFSQCNIATVSGRSRNIPKSTIFKRKPPIPFPEQFSLVTGLTCESGFEAGRPQEPDLRKCKKKGFFLQRASGGEQERLWPRYSIGNTAGSVSWQYFYDKTCNQSL